MSKKGVKKRIKELEKRVKELEKANKEREIAPFRVWENNENQNPGSATYNFSFSSEPLLFRSEETASVPVRPISILSSRP